MRFRDAYDPFRALAGAVRLVRAAPATMIVGAVLAAQVTPSWSFRFSEWDRRTAIVSCASCVVGLAMFLVGTLLKLGFATAVERVAVTGVERISDLWDPRGRYLSMALGQIVQWCLVLLAFLPFGLLGAGAALIGDEIGGDEGAVALGALTLLVTSPAYVFLWLGVLLVPEAVAFERLGPIAAVARSWKLARGNRLWLFWFVLVQVVVTFAGVCLCCVGVIATASLAQLASFEAYLRLVRDDHELWAIEGGAGAPLWSTGETPAPSGDPADPGL